MFNKFIFHFEQPKVQSLIIRYNWCQKRDSNGPNITTDDETVKKLNTDMNTGQDRTSAIQNKMNVGQEEIKNDASFIQDKINAEISAMSSNQEEFRKE